MSKMRIGGILNHRSVTMVLLLLALAGCTVSLPPVGPPGATLGSALPPNDGTIDLAERVDFAPGATAATRRGMLPAGSEKKYALAASAGQTMHVQAVGDSAPVSFTVYGPGGISWTGEAQASAAYTSTTQVDVPKHGDYLVTLAVPADATET